jgi:hypothetical protein
LGENHCDATVKSLIPSLLRTNIPKATLKTSRSPPPCDKGQASMCGGGGNAASLAATLARSSAATVGSTKTAWPKVIDRKEQFVIKNSASTILGKLCRVLDHRFSIFVAGQLNGPHADKHGDVRPAPALQIGKRSSPLFQK